MQSPLYIVWHERNETGISLIDEQHKGIVSIINSFYYMMGRGMGNHLLYSCISDTLKNYSRIHFITEETIFAESMYPDTASHKERHRQLTLEIERIEHRGIRINDAKPLLEFLKQWWLEHINEIDRHYVPYVHGGKRHHHQD
jgi:hemerythrin-like metal-binding protein